LINSRAATPCALFSRQLLPEEWRAAEDSLVDVAVEHNQQSCCLLFVSDSLCPTSSTASRPPTTCCGTKPTSNIGSRGMTRLISCSTASVAPSCSNCSKACRFDVLAENGGGEQGDRASRLLLRGAHTSVRRQRSRETQTPGCKTDNIFNLETSKSDVRLIKETKVSLEASSKRRIIGNANKEVEGDR